MFRLAVLLLLLCPAVFAVTFADLPGSTDEARIYNINRAVSQVRQFVAGHPCFTQFFPDPVDTDAIFRWSTWICAFFGGPAGNVNCSYTAGENGTVITDPAELAQELTSLHFDFEISTEQYDIFTELLSAALAGTDTAPAGLADDLFEHFAANLSLVNPAHADDGCPPITLTIEWALPEDTKTNQVNLPALVVWHWNDDAEHSIAPDVGETTLLVGFGSNTLSLTRDQGCLQGYAEFPEGGNACNLGGGGEFSYAQYFADGADGVLHYHCDVHAGLKGTLTLGAGSSSDGNTVTTPVDVDADADADADADTDGNDGGAAARIASWL